MRRHEKLLAELANALRAKSEAKKVWADKRADALEARGVFNEKVKLVEEINVEIETGSSGRPILDEIEAKVPPEPPPPPPEQPKPLPKPPGKPKPAASASSGRAAKKKAARQDQGPKLAGVEFPSTREILHELAQEADGKTDGSGGAAAPDAGDSKPAPSTGSPSTSSGQAGQAGPYREQKPDEKPFWTSGDLDLELMHAVFYGNQDWVDYKRSGATNEQILERLASRWPVFRLSVDGEDSGGNFGYTIACPGGEPAIWVGPYLGSHHKPSAAGAGLAERIRRLLEVPTPAASASSGQAKREPTISANGTGFTTPPSTSSGQAAVLQQPPEPSPEDKKPIRRQSNRGPR